MKLRSWQPFPGPPANSPLQPTYHRRNKCVMLVSAKAVWSLSSLRNTQLRVWVFCRTQANVQHFSAVWKLSLAGARKDDLNLGGVFSSLQSTAPKWWPGWGQAPWYSNCQPHLVVSHLIVKNLHGLCSCLQVRPVASSNITVTSTSFWEPECASCTSYSF